MDKGKQQTSNDLMREKAHLYQRLKNLFTGSFRYWVKKYENPDFTTTFSGFLSNLPGYRTEHRLQRVDGDSGEVKGDPDGSNNIEDPIHGKALQEYDDQSDLLTRVL